MLPGTYIKRAVAILIIAAVKQKFISVGGDRQYNLIPAGLRHGEIVVEPAVDAGFPAVAASPAQVSGGADQLLLFRRNAGGGEFRGGNYDFLRRTGKKQ